MTRLVLHESARWVRAVGAPLASFALITLVPSLLPAEGRGVAQSAGGELLSVVWVAACVASLAWLVANGVRAALQPAHDRRAFEGLQDLRVRSGLPDHALLCILRTAWSTPAGERADAVDVRTGAFVDLWLAESHLNDGSYALVNGRGGALLLLEAMPPDLVVGAQRHARWDGVSRHERTGRRQRRAAARVVRTAEMLLR